MAKTNQWKEDNEAMGIAMKLVDKYEQMFVHVDLSKILFIRILDKKSKLVAKMIANKFPYDINSSYVYFSQIFNKKWSLLTDNQKIVVVFEQLMGIPQGGFEETSTNYGKIRKKDVEQYSEVLSAVEGNFMWNSYGIDVNDLLEEKTEANEELDS